MEGVLLGAAVLACPVGMGLMMWFMGQGTRGRSDADSPVSVDALRDEHQRLGEEISRLAPRDSRRGAGRV